MKKVLFLVASTLMCSYLSAAAIYPLDRSEMIQNAKFDVKIEFDTVIEPADAKIEINGKSLKDTFGKEAEYVKDEEGKGSSFWLRDVSLVKGEYKVIASTKDENKEVHWVIYDTPDPVAKNVILFVGDGLSVAHRTAARILSKGFTEGRADGRLAMDDLTYAAFLGTSAQDSIATDSANTMSAYMTGQKTAVNALGVFTSRSSDPLNHPKQTTLGELIKQSTKKSLGIVADSEVQDATPAAVVAHTRKRAQKAEIAEQTYAIAPDVLLGGGSAYMIPSSTPGSKRKDEKNIIEMYKKDGYVFVTNEAELKENSADATKLLGLFHTGNMNTIVDRKFLKNNGAAKKFPNQPGLVDMTKAAIDVLSKNKDGFFLMVEAALIDKASHPLDWERAVMQTIELDQALAVALEFAKNDPNTLIIVVGDHTHSISAFGTVDDSKEGDMREKVGVYQNAGFPNYEDKDGDGYPDRLDVSKRLMVGFANHPDYYETFRPKLDGQFVPAVKNEKDEYVANAQYKDIPGAVWYEGNVPRDTDTGVHAIDDMVVQAQGPGGEMIKGYMDNTELFKAMVKALGIKVEK